MNIEDLLKVVLVAALVIVPTSCAVLTCIALHKNRPRWPAYLCLGGLLVGAAAAIPVAQNTAAAVEGEPARWWALIGLVITFCGNAAGLLTLLASRKWTRNAQFPSTTMAVWILATLFIGVSFLGPSRPNSPVVVPVKVKRG